VFAPATCESAHHEPVRILGRLLGVWSPVATHQVDFGAGPRSTT
jgi:hypothetical protein